MKYFAFPGTFGEPEVFNALAGKEIPHESTTVHGFNVAIQSPDKIKEPVKSRLDESWKGGYFGAFSLIRNNGRNAHVTVYEVNDEDAPVIEQRLAEWNMHDEGWFESAEFQAPLGNRGRTTKFRTEIIKDKDSLRHAPIAVLRKDLRYREFVTEMVKRLRNVYPQAPEGQITGNVEGRPGQIESRGRGIERY